MTKEQSKVDVVDGVAYQYSTEWIYALESEAHWRLYWQQQKLMQGLVKPGDTVLEVGIGSGFTANYLRGKGVSVTTMDIDAAKHPDIVANIVTYDFSHHYDHILAFEVFEHIPFTKFQEVLHKLAHVCNDYLFLSVPRCERTWFRCELRAPRIGHRIFDLTTRKRKKIGVHHFWELDDGKITSEMFECAITQTDLRIERRGKMLARYFYALDAKR